MRTSAALTLACVCLGCVACAPALQSPSVEVLEVSVSDFGLTGASAVLTMEVENPNRRDIRIRGVAYTVEVREPGDDGDWQELASDEREWRIVIPAEESVEVELDVPFTYRGAGAAVGSLLRRGEVRYRLSGVIRADSPWGEWRVPLRKTGVFQPGL